MKSTATALRLFLDEGAPKSVGTFFADKGHDVISLGEAIERSSPDTLVAEVALRNNAVLVAVDKDMRQIARRHGIGGTRYKRLNLLQFLCSQPQSIHRVAEAYSLIEHEWVVAQKKASRRFWVEIGDTFIRTHR